nr:immunoglobulin light chain junction region [Macaca mulatta]
DYYCSSWGASLNWIF